MICRKALGAASTDQQGTCGRTGHKSRRSSPPASARCASSARTRVRLAPLESIVVVGSFRLEPHPDGAESRGAVAAWRHRLAGFSPGAHETAEIEPDALSKHGAG